MAYTEVRNIKHVAHRTTGNQSFKLNYNLSCELNVTTSCPQHHNSL